MCLLKIISNLFNIKHTISYEKIINYLTRFNKENNDSIIITHEDIDQELNNEKFLNNLSKVLRDTINVNYHNYTYDKDDIEHQNLTNNLSNIRADIYSIKNININEFNIVSGKITPALSTTTSLISGLVIIDILKYLSKNNYKYTESNINLAINTYNIYDTSKPKMFFDNMFAEEYNMKVKTIPKDYTTWSKIHINCKNDLIFTIENLINFLNDQYTIIPELITYKNNIFYNSHKQDKYLNLKIKEMFIKFNVGFSEILMLDINSNCDNIPIFTPRLLLKII